MTGYHKFSQLIENFSEQRQAEIAKKTAQLKAEMAPHELRQALQLFLAAAMIYICAKGKTS